MSRNFNLLALNTKKAYFRALFSNFDFINDLFYFEKITAALTFPDAGPIEQVRK